MRDILFYNKIFILYTLIVLWLNFGGAFILKRKKPKISKKDINSLNWGEIEKKVGIDSSSEPSEHIKRRVIHDSVFARECKWFTKKDIKLWKDKGEKLLEKYDQIIKSH